jgi:hypothetical protein
VLRITAERVPNVNTNVATYKVLWPLPVLKCSQPHASWEAGVRPIKIRSILWIPKVHYCVKSLSLVPVLSQVNPVHTLISCFFFCKARYSKLLLFHPHNLWYRYTIHLHVLHVST